MLNELHLGTYIEIITSAIYKWLLNYIYSSVRTYQLKHGWNNL